MKTKIILLFIAKILLEFFNFSNQLAFYPKNSLTYHQYTVQFTKV
jgi:hypothetical protein